MYLALEGIDRAGKSTQIELLKKSYPQAIFTKEPGGTPLGQEIRHILLHSQHPAPLAEMFLFLADRNQHIHEVIKPNLDKFIVSDRSFLSGIAYAQMKTTLSFEELFALNKLALEGVLPNRVVMLELTGDELRKRFKTQSLDRIEKEGIDYLLKVQENLKTALFKSGIEYIIIDASKPKAHIFETIQQFLKEVNGD